MKLRIVATAYMYKELKKTNEEMEGVKGFNGKLVSFLSRPKPSPFTEPESETGNALQTQLEEKSLENQGDDLGTEYVLDLLERFQLTIAEHQELSKYCASKDVLYMCTPWDPVSISILETFNVPAYKIASADLTNHQLLKAAASTAKSVILSTGMSTETEIIAAIEALRQAGANFALLHCNSTYPAPFSSINLLYMDRLKNIGKMFC